jgi:hypothetical protein
MLESDGLGYWYAWFLGMSLILSSAFRFPEWTLIVFFRHNDSHVYVLPYEIHGVHLRVYNNNLQLFSGSKQFANFSTSHHLADYLHYGSANRTSSSRHQISIKGEGSPLPLPPSP